MRKPYALLALSLVLLTFVCTVPAIAQIVATSDAENTKNADTAMLNETPKKWFVQLSSPPVAENGTLAATQGDKARFRAEVKRSGLQLKERRSFDTLWNGLSVEAKSGDLPKLMRIPGVKAVFPVGTSALEPTQPNIGAELFTAVKMTGADVVQNDFGVTGRGVRVAIIDTGIDYTHPDLGGCFGKGCKVERGFDLVGDAYNANDANPIIAPDPDPFDNCNGHGTHVAGIVAAKGRVTGVAPDATLFAYRVFGCTGSTSDDIILEALERAQADRAQVVNMSLGAGFQWPEYPTSVASDNLVRQGVVVVVAQGNDGAAGLFGGSAPGSGNLVIAAASFENTHLFLTQFTAAPDNAGFGWIQAAAAPAGPTTGTFPLTKTGTPTTVNDGCNPLPAGSLTGKVVLIRRGTCGFNQKANNAQVAGAAAVILYNNVAGWVNPTVVGPPTINIPVVAVNDIEGVALDGRIAAGPVSLTWTATQASFLNNGGGGLMSGFSSYGPTPELSLKPDVGAPGGNIFSTFPQALGSYAVLSGTSMATPHTAGAAALLIASHDQGLGHGGGMGPDEIKTRLMNTSVPKAFALAPAAGLDNVHKQGSGLISIPDAINTRVTITPTSVAAGESQAGPATRRLTLHLDKSGKGNGRTTFNLSAVGAIATGGNTFAPSFFIGDATVTFSQGGVPVTSVAVDNKDTPVDVTITANPALPDRSEYGGYLVFTPTNGGAALRVPFVGFKGDYQSIVVLTPTANGFPWLAKLVGPNFVKQVAGASFNLTAGDQPFILAHFNHQSRFVHMDVIDATTNKTVGRFTDLEFFQRNTTATGFFAFNWDGTVTDGVTTTTVPAGSYIISVSVLKALGDANNPADVETFTSPQFSITR